MQKHSQTLHKQTSLVIDKCVHKNCCGQEIQLIHRLRGGQDEQTPDVRERIDKEKKISKKRRQEKKKWKKFDEEKKADAEVEKQKVQIITGPDGMIYALDPDFPPEVNFVPKPMPDEAEIDTKVYNETQLQEMEEKAARDEADQFLSFTRKPLADAELEKDLLDLVTECEKVRQIKKGANEVTKAINRNTAEFIIIAADTVPIEIVLHLPLLCEDKGVPFVWVSTRTALSKALNMHRPVTSTAILSNERSHLVGRIRKLRATVDNLPY
jgi:U4/U6 small nuclear ribonucleoprotein SNU13